MQASQQPSQNFHHHRSATVKISSIKSGQEVYDELDNKDQAQVRNLISSKEQIFYSGAVQKINKRLIPQNRILIVTDKALYNIQPKGDILTKMAFSISPSSALKRKIDIKKVFAITLSVKASSEHEQFVIHVNGEYDYRYDAGDKCERIIKSILNSYFLNFKVPFIMYLREEGDLAGFHTTDDDLKASIDKRPREGKIFVTPEVIAKGLDFIINNRKTLLHQTNMFGSVGDLNIVTAESVILNKDQLSQASMSVGPVPQGQNDPQNPFLAMNSSGAGQKNHLNRAQSVGRDNQPNFNIIQAKPQVNNVQLNFSNGPVEKPAPVVQEPVVQKQANVNMYETPNPMDAPPADQFAFLHENLVTTSNSNFNVALNFEDSLSGMNSNQKAVYYA